MAVRVGSPGLDGPILQVSWVGKHCYALVALSQVLEVPMFPEPITVGGALTSACHVIVASEEVSQWHQEAKMKEGTERVRKGGGL